MPNILVTGMPRSGTTLIVSLLNRQPNLIALAEPFIIDTDLGREGAVDQIETLLNEVRIAALAGAPITTKHVGGHVPDNWVEPPKAGGGLRRVLEERSGLHFDKPLTADFTLVVKHPAEFTALSDLLVHRYPLYAVVRDPVAVLAAWQTVDMPVRHGRMPMLERLAPEYLRAHLNAFESPLPRQVALIEFQLETYAALPRERVLRYEDVVANPGAALGSLCQGATDFPELAPYDPAKRYEGVDIDALADAVRPIMPLIKQFYPDIEDRWHGYLGTSCRSQPQEAPLSAR